jgi:hypothetical protein
VGPLYIDGGISFTPSASELALVGTNLYIDRDGIQKTPANDAIFSGSAITFTFDSLPAGVVVDAELVEVIPDATVPVAISQAGNTVTITPVQLKRNTGYTLGLTILSAGSQRPLYEVAASPALSLSGDLIQFTTADVEKVAALIKTNLYTNPATLVDAGAGATAPTTALNYFAPDANIVLTFGSPIPAGTVIDVELRDASYNIIRTAAPAVAGSVLTINPEDNLKPSAVYYLSVVIVDAQNGDYWKVPAQTGVTVINTSQRFAAIVQNSIDNKYYIGFSTQKDQAARLVSTNLYLDGNPANYDTEDGPFFRLDGSIVLTFADIPSGSRISKLVLADSTGQATGLSVYATLVGNTVTIKPNAKLDPDKTYYLQLALSKTVGADPVWSVTAADKEPEGIYGPVYVKYTSDAMQEIVFETVSTFSVVAAGGSSMTNLTAIGTAGITGDFDATSDIIIEFDRPVATVGKAQLRYHVGAEYYGTTASADTATGLSPDKKVLTIRPTNLLAPGATFVVRLDVTSADGQQLVYDSTNAGDPSAWANYVSAVPESIEDLDITVAGGSRFVGISKQAASGGTLRPEPNAAVPRAQNTLDLYFAASSVNFTQPYSLYVRRHDLWNTAPVQTITVNAGETQPVGGNAINSVAIPGPTPHVTAENVQYKARGINYNGYVVEATANITFQTTP